MIRSEAYIERMFKSLRRGAYEYLELTLDGKTVAYVREFGEDGAIDPMRWGRIWRIDLSMCESDVTIFFDSIKGDGI